MEYNATQQLNEQFWRAISSGGMKLGLDLRDLLEHILPTEISRIESNEHCFKLGDLFIGQSDDRYEREADKIATELVAAQ
jgi:hypothetical protein